ncbi:putative pentatricopeptide repeat-containing protein [Hibiscus syriacus]|uniref:Pentatricopeptide repeat-containing protein n=1 Tax=Hibiscus syriacus TaxID=106335 RepID=A0A6A2ZUR3_HIBSY|nr:putative pentatricopeptide repeat-containing protein [Hibiscus syriacus]
MKVVMRKDGCLATISERPVDFTDDNKWIEMDGNAMTNFHLALADEVLSSIEENKTTKEIWDHLTKLYEVTSLHNKIFLKRKLYTLRMSESTSVTEHLNTLNTLFSQLTSLSCKIVEQERAELLLQSLPDSYDQLIINLTNKRGQRSSYKHDRSKSRSKKNLKCYNCGKNGHLKKDCWSLNKNSNPQGNTENTSDDGDALCCEASTTIEGKKRYADIWLIDSGATYHMTSRREWFHHYEPVSGGSVYSCNDHALEIIGVGTIKLKMYNGIIKVVRDVRHVKGLKKNLLSYGLLNNNASKIETQKGIMKVFHGVLVVLKGEKIAANLYMLKGETLLEAEASIASCSSDSEMLWHQKLGHMSEQGMKVLVDKKLLPGLTKVSFPLCKHCITSKQHRLKFNTSNSRAKSVLELVHSDVWQTPVTSLSGAKYFVSFVDDYSRRCWVYPIKKKSDVFSTFKNFKARVELDYGNKIKSSQYHLLFGESSSINCNRAKDTNGDVNWDVIFVEDKLQRKEDDDSTEKSETTQIHMEKEVEQGDYSEAEPTHDEQEPESSEAPTTCQSDHVRRRPNWHSDYVIEGNIAYCLLIEDGEPSTYQEAINSSYASLWMMAMQEEIKALHKNNTCDLVPLPQGRKPIGYAQKEGIDFNEIFSPVARLTTVRVVLAMCSTLNLHLEQLDVKTAFLHGNLEEEIYMFQPEGFEDKEKKNLVCRLNADPCSYFKRPSDNDFVILLLYVDDMLVARPNKDHIEELKAQLAREFEMKDLGSANKILGIQIHRDRSNRKIWLSQKNYLKKILSRFNMQDCKPISSPLPINFKLSSSMSPSSEEERMEMSRVLYTSAVGSLMFAMICTRPDIAQAVGVVSRYMANPGKEHWNTVKRILRYIKGTSIVALCYGGSNLLINGYVNSGYAGDLDKSKSTTGYVFKVAGRAMLLEELGHNQEYVSLFCDSQSVLHLARNPTFHSRTKHIRVQYYFIREKVEEGTVDMQKINTKYNIADFMTKAIKLINFPGVDPLVACQKRKQHEGTSRLPQHTIRISRIVAETLRLKIDNVSLSESHIQNIFFSYGMAYGGGGFAISYPLAKVLARMQDRCIKRYPGLYDSDDQMQACMAELGVPLTKELGFHQYDVYVNLFGLFAAHPVTPLVSLHHLDVVEPIFPNVTRVQALRHLMLPAKFDSAGIIQQSICYDKAKGWTVSVSWGFAVQVFRGIFSPREIEMPSRTFLNWYRRADYTAYAFNTHPVTRNPCQKPFVFYMSIGRMDSKMNQTVSEYGRHHALHPPCRWKMADPDELETVIVHKKQDPHLRDRGHGIKVAKDYGGRCGCMQGW